MKEDILRMKEHNYSFKSIFKGHWVKTASVALLVIKGGMLQSLHVINMHSPITLILTCLYNIGILESCLHMCVHPL